ncbi:MAG TPA: PHP domain-containing protein [Clostridia bacterium]|nr:PHP domain-containing protein [Clostridia bacterium]
MVKKNEELVDLHIHTNASDGTWNIKEAIATIIEKNIKYFSITDHDTIKNSLEALKYVPRDRKFVLGSEISSTYKGKEYHILAYGFDPKNNALKKLISDNQLIRKKYNDDLIKYVKAYELVNDVSDYKNYVWDSARGGWKSLNYLFDKGIVKNLESYFELIEISQLTLEFKSPEIVIEIIKQAGGYSILAHPSAYGEKFMSIAMLEKWKAFGINGIECYSPYFENRKDAAYYVKYCKENSLMISGGSDCHGKFNDRFIGVPKVTWAETALERIFNIK